MSDAPIANLELYHVALPTRREHKWTGLTEPIGGYVVVKMVDTQGGIGWGEAPALRTGVATSAVISVKRPPQR
jgi:L-alanine-DL-glutamate epimerase-like enolase superfamily enzyme